jgi:hypothetical protein
MTSDSPSTVPLSDLLDDFALNTMAQLIHSYAPEALCNDADAILDWCDNIAKNSYCMAAAMIDMRSEFHKIILEGGKEEETDAS